MKLAFVTRFDAQDVRRGSGTFFHMAQAIERQGHEIVYITLPPARLPPLSRLLRRVHQWRKRRYVAFLDPLAGRVTGRFVTAALQRQRCDLVLTNDMVVSAFVEAEAPLVLYTDVMITSDYAEKALPQARLGNLSPLSLWLCRQTIRRALHRADIAVFPADWALRAAQSYSPYPDKLRLIPFGANIEDPGSAPTTGRMLRDPGGRLELLFVGKDWARKGGDVAVAVASALKARGHDVTLHCAGAVPADPPPFVQAHGLLDKQNPAGRAQLAALFGRCGLLLLPSQSEGFVIAPLEAAAYGVPTLGYAAPGVIEAVRHGESGWLLPPGAPPDLFADQIEAWLADQAAYERLSLGARRYFEDEVNWQTAIERLMAVVTPLLAKQSAPVA